MSGARGGREEVGAGWQVARGHQGMSVVEMHKVCGFQNVKVFQLLEGKISRYIYCLLHRHDRAVVKSGNIYSEQKRDNGLK